VLVGSNNGKISLPQAVDVERTHRRHTAPLLSPDLTKALRDLAASEDLPLATFVAVLINEALTRRLHRSQP
jgi:hypothetical protein